MNKYWKDRKLWNEKIETMSEEVMRALQWKRFKKQLRYDYDHSIYYQEKFKEVGLAPQNIHSFEDFQKIPLMTKDEHRKAQQESIERFGHP